MSLSEREKSLLCLAAIAAAALLAFSPCLFNGFLFMDDPQLVWQIPLVRDFSPAGVARIFLHPPADLKTEKNINDASVVLKIADGADTFLLTGDIQQKAIRSLLASGQDLQAEVLKVPHHGGKMGEVGRVFLEAVRPHTSLISAGERNPFGHPAQATLEALAALPENQILRTDDHGSWTLSKSAESQKARIS